MGQEIFVPEAFLLPDPQVSFVTNSDLLRDCSAAQTNVSKLIFSGPKPRIFEKKKFSFLTFSSTLPVRTAAGESGFQSLSSATTFHVCWVPKPLYFGRHSAAIRAKQRLYRGFRDTDVGSKKCLWVKQYLCPRVFYCLTRRPVP